MRKINFGIVGLGRIGKIHFQNIQFHCENAIILAASNLNSNNQKWVKERGVEIIYDSFELMVSNPNIDAVIIASPTSFHAQHIELACKAGKAI